MTEPEWTPIQQLMISILDDGQAHSPKELHACMGPSSLSSVQKHIHMIRKKLLPLGQTILAEYFERRCFYRRVILFGRASPTFTQE
jgi:hypothetical protein